MYNLGKYRYKNCAIYRKVFLPFFKMIDPGPYSYTEGVREVNRLCGIVEEERPYPELEPVIVDDNIKGRFLVNFKRPEWHFGNDPLPATIQQYSGRLQVKWDNGYECVTTPSSLNIYVLYE